MINVLSIVIITRDIVDDMLYFVVSTHAFVLDCRLFLAAATYL